MSFFEEDGFGGVLSAGVAVCIRCVVGAVKGTRVSWGCAAPLTFGPLKCCWHR
jgi:hypothetical protein